MADEQQYREVLTGIDALAIAVHRGFERVDVRLNGLEGEMREMRSGLAEVRGGLTEVRGGLDTLRSKCERSSQTFAA